MMALAGTDSATGNESRRKLVRRLILGGILIFLILVALLVARYGTENDTQATLAKQRDTQQTWVSFSVP